MSESRKVPTCPRARFAVDRSVGELFTKWAALTPAAHTFEDICDPMYFGAFAAKDPNRQADQGVKPGDFIEVSPDDHSWYARFKVVGVTRGRAEMHIRQIEFIDMRAEDLPEGYEIVHRGAAMGHVILLNGELIEKGFLTPESAGQRLKTLLAEDDARSRINAASKKAAAAKPAAKGKGKADRDPVEPANGDLEKAEA